jgi:hypothetical protein
MAERTGRRGFWAGFLTGLAVALLAALALAWIYPPLQPPAVDDGALDAPGEPDAPERGAAAPGPLLTPAPGPVVEGLPDLTAPLEDGTEPGPGSPSLVPAADE